MLPRDGEEGFEILWELPNEARTVDNKTIMLPESTIQSCGSAANKGSISRSPPMPYCHSAMTGYRGLVLTTTAEIHNDVIGRDEVHTYENMNRQGNDNLQVANASSDNHDNRSDNGQAGRNTVPSVHAESPPIQCYEDALSVYEVYIL